MIKKIEQFGRLKCSILITIAAFVLSQIITAIVYSVTHSNYTLSGRIASFASPLIIAPFISWWFVGLLLKISNLEKEMRELASFDKLTGAYNRNTFFPICTSLLGLLRRDNADLTILYIDIDHFKNVNDTFGHNIGDLVLKKVGEYVINIIRKSDIFGRIGGEEFVVFLPNTNIENGVAVAEKIRSGISNMEVKINGVLLIKVTVSIGISSSSKNETVEIDEIIKMADVALYQAKNEGRNRLYVNTNCMNEYQNANRLELIGQ